MNPILSYRSNVLGTLTATPTQREGALYDITAMMRARLKGLNRSAKTADDVVAKAAVGQAQKSQTSASGQTGTSNDLDKDVFLLLLVTQMQHQDPMSPMDNTDMIAQLAQFSALEQMNNLNESFNNRFEVLNARINQLNFVSAQGLIGHHVRGIDIHGAEISGTVESVVFDLGEVMLRIGDEYVPVVNILSFGHERLPADETAPETAEDAETVPDADEWPEADTYLPEEGIGA